LIVEFLVISLRTGDNQRTGVEFRECQRCGAIIRPEAKEVHAQWHADLEEKQ
jgi:hypothetical protein